MPKSKRPADYGNHTLRLDATIEIGIPAPDAFHDSDVRAPWHQAASICGFQQGHFEPLRMHERIDGVEVIPQMKLICVLGEYGDSGFQPIADGVATGYPVSCEEDLKEFKTSILT